MHSFKIASVLICGLLFYGARPAPVPARTNWISLDEAQQKFALEKRPILIDLYTDWCGWCKVMDRKTYSNKQVSEYLAGKFYTVKVNAEGRENITWKGKTFAFNPQYKAHDFAIYLTRGQLSFPTTVILPADGSAPQAIPGFLEPKDFELIVKYFGEGHYGKQPFTEFRDSFKGSW